MSIKGFNINGNIEKIDYESLENKPSLEVPYTEDDEGNVVFENDIYIDGATSVRDVKGSVDTLQTDVAALQADSGSYTPQLVEGIIFDVDDEGNIDLSTRGLSANRGAIPTAKSAWIEGNNANSIDVMDSSSFGYELSSQPYVNITTAYNSNLKTDITTTKIIIPTSDNAVATDVKSKLLGCSHFSVVFEDAIEQTYFLSGNSIEIGTNLTDVEIKFSFVPNNDAFDVSADIAARYIKGLIALPKNGDYSHTEGSNTTASGVASHSEGSSSNSASSIITASTTNDEIVAAWKASGESSFSLAKGKGSHVEGENCLALSDFSHAEGSNTVAIGAASHAEGNFTTASGVASHAEGSSTTAKGNFSHSEGFDTTASGDYSHAEGNATTASVNYSHAEGNATTASGAASHAEGYGTTASNNSSHAEGLGTTASGVASHAEGGYTTANDSYSHAEGWGTVASGQYSHAQGRFNIEDTENKYAHIVGNGTADDACSNAHTLDWDGNAWFAGGVEATGIILSSTTEGSTKRFLVTVDDTGTLTVTEIVEETAAE